jgi:hypothetical protein
MSDQMKNWVTVTESRYTWERDALDFVRDRWPDHEPYRAWANFEFIALDGSINEVDLLLLTPKGLFLVEVKSRPGCVSGDPGTWTWDTEGRLVTAANPLLAANLKAKKLRQLLERQKAVKVKGSLPWVEALVFLAAPNVRCELRGTAAYRVCLRDRDASPGQPERPGLLAAVRRRECPGLEADPRTPVDRPLAKVISQAMEQAGVHSSQRHRRVSDYLLERLIEEGPGYQDWEAGHVQDVGGKRRVRLYLVWNEATAEDRRVIERAARRDFQLTEALQHPGWATSCRWATCSTSWPTATRRSVPRWPSTSRTPKGSTTRSCCRCWRSSTAGLRTWSSCPGTTPGGSPSATTTGWSRRSCCRPWCPAWRRCGA